MILASSSPRRSRLLRQIGLDFSIDPASIDESYDGTPASEFARAVAARKAEAVSVRYEDGIVLAADTIVVLDEVILGKPGDAQEARDMLGKLSGAVHEVITGVALIDKPGSTLRIEHEITKVWFRKLSDDEIEEYIRLGSPFDKAGAYGIQDDYGAVFVRRIEGCFYNVVGLPLSRVYTMLHGH